jgi:pilus assembly protein Flp/PilA
LSKVYRVARNFTIRRFWADERGATAIEYGLLCGMISVAVFGLIAAGGGLSATYDKMKDIITALGGGGDNDGG